MAMNGANISSVREQGCLLRRVSSISPRSDLQHASGDVAGLISAINTANRNAQDDTINLAAGGGYTLTSASSGEDGFLIITLDSGHSLTINSNGATEMISPSLSASRLSARITVWSAKMR
jgi:hypothetical protein